MFWLAVGTDLQFFHHPSFLKAFTLRIHPEFYEDTQRGECDAGADEYVTTSAVEANSSTTSLSSGIPNVKHPMTSNSIRDMDSSTGMVIPPFQGWVAIPYVGKSSFIIHTEAFCSGESSVPFCSCERFCVAVKAGKSRYLEPEWKAEAQRAIEASGFCV